MRTMPFGRFKGLPVTELPTEYLVWLLRAVDLREPLRSALRVEATARGLTGDPGPALAPGRAWAEDLIGAGLRVLARQHHPDAGGDVRTMQQVNAAASWLRDRARELAS